MHGTDYLIKTLTNASNYLVLLTFMLNHSTCEITYIFVNWDIYLADWQI